MRKMKKLIAFAITFAMALSMWVFCVGASDDGISLCGTTVPTSAYYLSKGEYTSTFSGVAAGIYTSKYFVANDNTIRVAFSRVSTTSSEYQKIAYWLYNMTSGYYVEKAANYTSETKSGGSKASGAHAFSSSTGDHYYVWFRSHNGGKMSGTIAVG